MAGIVKDLLGLQYSENFLIEGIQEENVNLKLPQAKEVSAVVFGKVMDGENPVANATIKMFDASGQPYRHTMTDLGGEYTFSDVPAGTYSLGAVAEHYRLSDLQPVTLSGSDTTQINFSMVKDVSLALGTIAGVLLANLQSGGTAPLAGAKVTLQDIREEAVAVTYTADDGEFVFYDVADGIYLIMASADGYLTPSAMTVTITNGSIANVKFAMDIDTRTYKGTVSGVVKNSIGYVMPNCFVGLYQIVDDGMGGTREMLVATTKTNGAGQYLFGNVSGGKYLVKAKMNA